MAPESVLDNRTSHQSDLFALGVIAYKLTTGYHPFLSEDAEPVRVNARVAEENPKSVRELRPDVPELLAELVTSLLAKRADDRPRSAIDVCRTLETIGKAARRTDNLLTMIDEMIDFAYMTADLQPNLEAVPLSVADLVADTVDACSALADANGMRIETHCPAGLELRANRDLTLSHFIKRFNYENNLIGSVNLINAAVNTGVKCFVFTSSIAVYGASPKLPMTEETPAHPEDPYGFAKLAVEQELRVCKEMFGLDYVIFRPHNVYGERQNIGDKYGMWLGSS